MTMQIENFIEDVKNGKVQSEKHCLEDTKKILEASEMISSHIKIIKIICMTTWKKMRK